MQYSAPVFRKMAQHPKLDFLLAYCSLQGAERGLDPEFGMEVEWDVPLLDGYPWVLVPNKARRPGLGRFFGLWNPGLWKLIRDGGFDAVVSFVGYNFASFWILLAAAKAHGRPLLLGTDAHEWNPGHAPRWKATVKRMVWPRLFRLADVVWVSSSGGMAMMRELGIPAERIALLPSVVGNDWWATHRERADRQAVRRDWGVPEDIPLVLFCGKLQPWKRPQDVLRALASADISQAHLVYVGVGPLQGNLEAEAAKLGLAARTQFLGFRNQSQLPPIYSAADILVLPSAYEAFGLVVNEAMLCGCPVVVSDRVGAKYDLVREGETGFVYPCGDVESLAAILREVLPDRDRLLRMGQAARRRMEAWSPLEYVEALVEAIERATRWKVRQAGAARPSPV